MAKKNVKWRKYLGTQYEGTINGERAFEISGLLCIQDTRDIDNIKAYKISSVEEAKQIAEDLINGVNLEIHEKNYQDWEAENQKTVNLIQSTDALLKSIADGTYQAPKKTLVVLGIVHQNMIVDGEIYTPYFWIGNQGFDLGRTDDLESASFTIKMLEVALKHLNPSADYVVNKSKAHYWGDETKIVR